MCYSNKNSGLENSALIASFYMIDDLAIMWQM